LRRDRDKALTEFIESRNRFRKNPTALLKKDYKKKQAVVWECFDYLVLLKAKRYKIFPNYPDLVQEGRVALLASLETFVPEKGSFTWWANQYIKTKLSREANKHSTMRIPMKVAKTCAPQKIDINGEEAKLNPLLTNTCFGTQAAIEIFEQENVKNEVWSAIKELGPMEQKVVALSTFQEYTINQISSMLEISPYVCSRILNKGLANLKTSLQKLAIGW